MYLMGIGRRLFILLLSLPLFMQEGISQNYPEFGPERAVNIIGLDFDAMEPFISPDGKYLFFNNLNDGIETKLFYAEYVNDSTLNFIGELPGAGQPAPPHLDAVADLDSLGNFYWTSTRQYPAELDNLHYGTFNGNSVSNIGRVRGDFNMNTPGWLVMDHGISLDGQLLYYNNARFNSDECTGPCETHIGIAEKIDASTFTKIAESSTILQNVNDPDYIYYAPCISTDNLELYYTRYRKGEVTIDTQIEICVAVRDEPNGVFSLPKILFADNPVNIVEAVTLTRDQRIMYYHRKVDGLHVIKMRQRSLVTGLENLQQFPASNLAISPNPMEDIASISFNHMGKSKVSLTIVNLSGQIVKRFREVNSDQIHISTSELSKGLYVVNLMADGENMESKKLLVK